MGQTLETVTKFANWGGELDTDVGTGNEITDIPEPNQRMHITDWGQMRDLDLVWTKHDDQMEDLRSVAILPDEGVIVTSLATANARRFNRDGADVTIYTGNNSLPFEPSGVACSRNGTVILLCNNKYVRGIREFCLDKPYRQHRMYRKLFSDSTMVAVAPSCGLWVIAEAGEEHCVNILRDNGTRIRYFGMQYLTHPSGVAVDAMDRIYVTDMKQHEVLVFTMHGDFLFRFGSHGAGMNQFDCPQGICIDPQNNLYIADQFNDRVSVYSPDGRFKFHLNFPKEKPAKQPKGLALDSFTGRLAVTALDMQRASLDLFVLHGPTVLAQ